MITTTATIHPQQTYLIKGLANFQMAQLMHHREIHVMED